jgi:hypothetical protein
LNGIQDQARVVQGGREADRDNSSGDRAHRNLPGRANNASAPIGPGVVIMPRF